jgi:hypothetical protein
MCRSKEIIQQAGIMIEIAKEEKDNLFEKSIEVPETE